jgi:hypothetical protein
MMDEVYRENIEAMPGVQVPRRSTRGTGASRRMFPFLPGGSAKGVGENVGDEDSDEIA